MILLYTDFGRIGPYVGEMHAVLAGLAPGVAIVDLMHDAPRYDPGAAGVYLESLLDQLPRRCVIVAVVDPGVGSERRCVIARAGERWLVGPDNGLFAPCLSVSGARAWEIPVPDDASASFHGRDVFAPAGAHLATGVMPRSAIPIDDWVGREYEPERQRVIYVDAFGNCATGIKATSLGAHPGVRVAGRSVPFARTFSAVERGEPFWYVNSAGLVEVAINQGSAADALGIGVGTGVTLT